MTTITVRHNFETAHRLPQLGGKCSNLHGHSWWASVTIAADMLDDRGVVADFGVVKAGFRSWVDRHLDHGVMLAATDPLVAPLAAEVCKVYRFNAPDPSEAEAYARGLPYPTVELVAELLLRVAEDVLAPLVVADEAIRLGPPRRTRVERVDVQETHVNSASCALVRR